MDIFLSRALSTGEGLGNNKMASVQTFLHAGLGFHLAVCFELGSRSARNLACQSYHVTSVQSLLIACHHVTNVYRELRVPILA